MEVNRRHTGTILAAMCALALSAPPPSREEEDPLVPRPEEDQNSNPVQEAFILTLPTETTFPTHDVTVPGEVKSEPRRKPAHAHKHWGRSIKQGHIGPRGTQGNKTARRMRHWAK